MCALLPLNHDTNLLAAGNSALHCCQSATGALHWRQVCPRVGIALHAATGAAHVAVAVGVGAHAVDAEVAVLGVHALVVGIGGDARFGAGATEVARVAKQGNDDGREDAEDGNDNHQFDEREAAVARCCATHGFRRAGQVECGEGECERREDGEECELKRHGESPWCRVDGKGAVHYGTLFILFCQIPLIF